MITTRKLSRTYGDRGKPVEALRGVDMEIQDGEFVGVTGPSGSGKSTLLRILGGLDRGFDGDVEVNGKHLGSMSERDAVAFRAEQVGFVFQDYSLLAHLNALENVQLANVFHRSGKKKQSEKTARGLLELVGLGQRTDARPSELSGGQQQRVAIARALMGEPRVLLCDEPTGNLDLDTGDQILDLLETTRKERGVTIIVVTHEPHVVSRLDREISLRDGRIAESSRADGLATSTTDSTLKRPFTEERP